MNKKISGKKIAYNLKQDIKKKISELNKEIIFSIIYIGQDPVIDNFIAYKKKFGTEVGVNVVIHYFDDNVSEDKVLSEISKISKKSDAVIVQLPLPKHLDTSFILNQIPATKDVDVLSRHSRIDFERNRSLFIPPVTGAMLNVLKSKNFSLKDKNIVVIGNGDLVGKPFIFWLRSHQIPYVLIDKNTPQNITIKNLKKADLIVSGTGVPGIITGNMITDGVVLLDGGTAEVGKKIRGDIDPSCYSKALFYTPVPGGIGPITIAVLYQNIVRAVINSRGI